MWHWYITVRKHMTLRAQKTKMYCTQLCAWSRRPRPNLTITSFCCSQLESTPRSMSGRAARILETAVSGSELPPLNLTTVSGSARWRPPISLRRTPWRHCRSDSSYEVCNSEFGNSFVTFSITDCNSRFISTLFIIYLRTYVNYSVKFLIFRTKMFVGSLGCYISRNFICFRTVECRSYIELCIGCHG